MRKTCSALLLSATLGAALATPAAAPPDPALERRVAALAEQLRCVVCQNQTIADSEAELAVDLRQQVREQLAQGSSEAQVIDFMVQRYGDFVLYRPPLKSGTLLLWFGPFVLLAAGLLALASRLAAQRRQAPAPPAPQELARGAALLAPESGEEAR